MNEHVVLVTGALTGIGRATATAFGRDGASVVVSGRHDEEGEALAAELRTLGGKAEYLRADVSIEDDVRSLIDATIETFGQLDAAVNNAAHTNQFGRLVTQTAEAYDATFNTNVRGLLFCLKHELRVMIERGQGSIVNLSSTYGERGVAGAGLYAASKHAVNGLTRSAALEVATTGVRVNAVAPGPIATGALARFTGPDSRASSAASVPMGPWAKSTRSPTSSRSSAPTRRGSSPARSSPSTAARQPFEPVSTEPKAPIAAASCGCRLSLLHSETKEGST